MFCQICGSYIREYKNTLDINDNTNSNNSLIERHLKSKFHTTNVLIKK